MKTILDYVEKHAFQNPEKIAYVDSKNKISYKELIERAKALGSYLIEKNEINRPVVIFLDKTVESMVAILGVLYSGNYYVYLDSSMPEERLLKIEEMLDSPLYISNEKRFKRFNKDFIDIEDSFLKDEEILAEVRAKLVDTNPMYILFTSGSTGNPKGVVVSHRACLSYLNWLTEEFKYDEETVFGNQTELYFSMSLSDAICNLKVGGKCVLIPKSNFIFLKNLFTLLNEEKVNTLYWVPSAYSILKNFNALENYKLEHVENVLFAGEVMPVKVLNYLRKNLPDASFTNMFGPSETVDICTFYRVDRSFKETETLPIGKACPNLNYYILDEEEKESKEGELCISGSFLASGYFRNTEKTNEAFVQNPLNDKYLETIYKTGDLVRLNDFGELEFISRKDFQIKHLGYRIELGEIETILNSIEEIKTGVVLYENSEIIAFYEGEIEKEEVLTYLKNHLQHYMIPSNVYKLDKMLYNQNGKKDRKALKKLLIKE